MVKWGYENMTRVFFIFLLSSPLLGALFTGLGFRVSSILQDSKMLEGPCMMSQCLAKELSSLFSKSGFGL
jgi:hypothetical protein